MSNSGGKPIVGKNDKKKEKGTPLILYTIDIKTNSTHTQGLHVQFFMAIGVMLVIRTNCDKS